MGFDQKGKHSNNWDSRRKEREKRAEILVKEIIAENFPGPEKDMEIHVQEGNPSPCFLNAKDLL